MNKTISINIAGTIFHIEEDAYTKLDQYLKSIKQHFQSYPDSSEIVADMEARIAEQFLTGKENLKDKIVTLAEVNNLIGVMAKVEDFGDDSNSEQTARTSTSTGKKLYRDTDRGIIAGVSSGLGAYFGVDPIVFRVLFIILVMAGASGVLIYIIMWIVMPEAKTMAQKMEMKGEPVNLSEIERDLKDGVNKIKDSGAITKTVNGLARVIRAILNLIIKLAGLFFVLMVTLGIFASTFSYAVALFNHNSPYVDFPVSQVITGPSYYFVATLAYLAIILPLVLLIVFGASLMRKKNLLKVGVVVPIVTIWFAVICIGGAFASRHLPEYRDRLNALPEYQVVSKNYSDLNDFTKLNVSSAIRINIKQGSEYSVSATGRQAELDRLTLSSKDHTLTAHQEWTDKICIFCFDSNGVTLDVTMPNLDAITLSGASRLVSEEPMTLKDLKFDLSGASRVNMNVALNNVTADLSGSSVLQLTGTGKDLTLDLSGASRFINGEYKVAANNVTATLSGASYAEMHGSAKSLNLKLNGASRFISDELTADTAAIEAHGSSQASMGVSSQLKVTASGASRIMYTGSPKIDQDLSGSSKLIEE